jgi:hypothetical protein
MIREFTTPKPKSSYNHYSNPSCQGTLLCETQNFPKSFNDKVYEENEAYTDRMAEWDYENYRKSMDIFKGGSMEKAKDKTLKEFAQIAFKKSVLPKHVRIIYYFNVSSGYSCPLVIALFNKKNG